MSGFSPNNARDVLDMVCKYASVSNSGVFQILMLLFGSPRMMARFIEMEPANAMALLGLGLAEVAGPQDI